MAPEPVGPPPGYFDDDPTPEPPKESPLGSILFAVGVLAVSVFFGIRSCSSGASRARPRRGSP